jgi:anthranilate phosphoribosyltransferase
MNAAAALVAGGAANELREGFKTAAHSIDSGAAMRKLEELVHYSHKLPGETGKEWR